MRNIVPILVVLILLLIPACSSDSDSPIDSDGDGWTDDRERTAGTNLRNVDTDGDGYWDPSDSNPLDPNIPSSLHNAPQTVASQPIKTSSSPTYSPPPADSDNDGTPDRNDACQFDPNKTEPGVCGCGTPDTDTDRDGTLDCNDACPSDPNKAGPGQCGCGVVDTDSDGDGVADCVDPTPNPSLNVRLNYISIENVHDSSFDDTWYAGGVGDEVQVFTIVTDGETVKDMSFPPAGEFYLMEQCDIQKIDETIFHIDSIGDQLEMLLVAYDKDSTEVFQNFFDAFGSLSATPEATLGKKLAELLEGEDYIGYYRQTWYPNDDWGIGQYEAEGFEDLRIWFSIYSDKTPVFPTIQPDVRIESFTADSEIEQCPSWYFSCSSYENPHVIRLHNNEKFDIKIKWKVQFSDREGYDTAASVIPAHSVNTIERGYFYQKKLGPVTETLTIYFDDEELDSKSCTVNVVE